MGYIATALLAAVTVLGLPWEAFAQTEESASSLGTTGFGVGTPALAAAAVVAWLCVLCLVAFQFRRQRQLQGRLEELEGQLNRLGQQRED